MVGTSSAGGSGRADCAEDPKTMLTVFCCGVGRMARVLRQCLRQAHEVQLLLACLQAQGGAFPPKLDWAREHVERREQGQQREVGE